MSRHAGVKQTLELLESLRGVVRDFAAREEKLEQDFQAKVRAARHRRDTGTAEAEESLAAQITDIEAQFQAAREHAEARFRQRKAQIAEATRVSRKRRLEQAESREGTRKHRLQTETLQNKRNRESGLANAERAWQEFKDALAADETQLAALENKARRVFAGYGKFRRLLRNAPAKSSPDLMRDEYQLTTELRQLLSQAGQDLDRFRGRLLPAFFRWRWIWALLVLAQLPLVPLLQNFGLASFSYAEAEGSVIGLFVVGFVLHQVGKSQSEPLARQIASALGKARRLCEVCPEKAERRYHDEIARLENEFQATSQRIEQEWSQAVEEGAIRREACPQEIETKAARVAAKHTQYHRLKLEQIERARTNTLESLKAEARSRIAGLAGACADLERKFEAERDAVWRGLELEWKQKIQPLYQQVASAKADAEKLFPSWEQIAQSWTPPAQFSQAAQFGRMEVDLPRLAEAMPKDPRLALGGPAEFSLPLLLNFPEEGSILLETNGPGREQMIAALNNLILRLLSTAPPGRLSFTIIDPVGLGQSFSGIMHLADHAEHLINSRIWTQTGQIEQRLAELNEHMEKVIQMYLRNEYATISEYNEQAGNIAEKYHFVVVADFPSNFSELAAKRLLSIATSGARCGVFTLLHWDRRQLSPQEIIPDDLRKSSVCVSGKGSELAFTGRFLPGTKLLFDPPPTPDLVTGFIHKVGLRSKDSNRVEVPFSHVAPAEPELWSLETTQELRVPIGRTGATKLQYLAIGKGTRQHALLAGKTGSGKSTLFHVIITNLALWCSPEQVEFYLVDFKKGVEFKCYAAHKLPHARVVAIESDREFGLSVLQRLDDELKRRGDLFRKLGVQDVPGYKRVGGKEPVPRSLLIIDEFQEFFVEDDKISQNASLLLDRIVRQGRAFGIHVLLGSQTLGGAYTVARTTLGQMVIRIALQCNEADAYLIMDDNNPAPRLLSRPGEGIYNDAAGNLQGNSPFQAVWLPDEVRDSYLERVEAKAAQTGVAYAGPVVFEGNAPADVRENAILKTVLEAPSLAPASAARIWLGSPNSIKGPTEVVFQRQSGNHLLVVGQSDEAALAIVSVGLVSLAAQFAPGKARFIVCDSNPPGTPARQLLEKIIRAIPHPITLPQPSELGEILGELAEELKKRSEDPRSDEAPAIFLIIHGFQRYNKLRYEEDFGFGGSDAPATANPGALLNTLISEGARLGIHVIATFDSFNSVNRFLSRKALSEFELRVLFQMSATDSASLIDSPKAGALGLHRALLSNAQQGQLETFRPYALPPDDWIEQAGRNLARLLK